MRVFVFGVVAFFLSVGYLTANEKAFPSSRLNMDLLISAIEEKNLSTIELILNWIHINYPEQLEHFTLMNRSLSLQEGKPLNPRAIVYGTDASFIFTFNGDSRQKKFEALEMMQFKAEQGDVPSHFELREVFFLSGQKPLLSEINPSQCQRCHHTESRPIWEPYEIWDGAYGKYDDSMIDYDSEKYANRSNEAKVAENRRDFENFKKFSSIQPSHARYRYLKMPSGSQTPPYAPHEKYHDYRLRPNLRLTESLSRLQGEAVASRLVVKSQLGNRVDALISAILLNCKLEPKFGTERLAQIYAETEASVLNTFPGAESVTPISNYADRVTDVAGLLRVSGIDIGQFSMSSQRPRWTYFDGLYFQSEHFIASLYGKLMKKHALPSVRIRRSYGTESTLGNRPEDKPNAPTIAPIIASVEEVCERLINLADGAIGADLKFKFTIDSPQSGNTFNMCLSCHGQRLKLDLNHSTVRQKIVDRIMPTAKLRMPPDRILDDRERLDLLIYLKKFD